MSRFVLEGCVLELDPFSVPIVMLREQAYLAMPQDANRHRNFIRR